MSKQTTEKKSKMPQGDTKFFSDNSSDDPSIVNLKAGLYLVATPIGNLKDITFRALEILSHVDLVLCEDTRVTIKLFNAYGLKKKLRSYNDHNEMRQIEEVISYISQGHSVALVSDAGMPLISDPGYKLVRNCLSRDIFVTSLPGANSVLTALQLSGLPSDNFCFLGFLPNKSAAREAYLLQWKSVNATLIAFETAPRLLASLQDMHNVFGVREVAIIREMTKMFEEIKKGSFSYLISYYQEHGLPKGEVVVVIGAAPPKVATDDEITHYLREALVTMKTKEAASFIAEMLGVPRKDVYQRALALIGKNKP